MNREEAIAVLRRDIEPSVYEDEKSIAEALDMAIEALSANATLAKIQIDDIDKAKTSSQLLDELAVDMVNAMGKRIVEVVYCKDCRHYECGGLPCPLDVCESLGDDGFCSRGERRSDD